MDQSKFLKPAGDVIRFMMKSAVVLACGWLVSCGNASLSPGTSHTLKPNEGYVVAGWNQKGIDNSGHLMKLSVFSQVQIAKEGDESMGKHLGFPNRINLTAGIDLDHFRAPRLFDPGEINMYQAAALPLPAGNYEIVGWRIDNSTNATYYNRLPMKVPFRVEAGKATYIGRVNTLTRYGKNLIGLTVPGESVILITDQYAEDRKKISGLFPFIPSSEIKPSNVPAVYQKEVSRIINTPSKWLGLF